MSELALRSKAHWPYDAEFIESCREDLAVSSSFIESKMLEVMEIDGQVVGFFGFENGDLGPEMNALFLDPVFIGRGLGKKLWQRALDFAQTKDWSKFAIVADPYAAESFYLRNGCEQKGEVVSPVRANRKLPLLEYRMEPKKDSVEVSYASVEWIPSFYNALTEVADERVFLEMIEPPPLDKTIDFQSGLIQRNAPVFYATCEEKVVGWADISSGSNPRLAHRGFLGMGVIKSFRGKGVGSRLLSAAIEHARGQGLEKVELSVYSSNQAAVQLYKKFGFSQMGFIKNYRKLDDVYFHTVEMELFL